MNTPAHILICAAALSHRRHGPETRLAGIGGLLPDLSLYLLVGVSLFALRISPRTVFGELYFSDGWQTVFAIDNSILLWSMCVGFGVWSGKRWLSILGFACLLHIALDLPLHHDDGRAHFWPLTSWVFESPVSYWDSRHHAAYVAPVEGFLAVAAAALLSLRHVSVPARLAVAVLLLAEFYVIRQWILFF